jgi:hypothetical protein
MTKTKNENREIDISMLRIAKTPTNLSSKFIIPENLGIMDNPSQTAPKVLVVFES